jgi:hypothetical protein
MFNGFHYETPFPMAYKVLKYEGRLKFKFNIDLFFIDSISADHSGRAV